MIGGNNKGTEGIYFERKIDITSEHIGIELSFNAFALNGWDKT